jgi:SPOR domain
LKTLVFLLLLANLTLFAYIKLDSVGTGEGVRLNQQVQPDKIKLLGPQQVAALGPAKVASLADVCLEWGPISDADRARAMASLDPLDLGKLISQKKVEVITNYWVFIPPQANKAAADKRVADLKAQGVRDVVAMDGGPQRFAISLGVFRSEDAAQARLAALQAQGVTLAQVGPRAQSVQQSMLVVRDPPAPAVIRMKELQGEFQGSEIKIGTCEKTG